LNLHPNEPHKPPFGLLVLLFSVANSAVGGLHYRAEVEGFTWWVLLLVGGSPRELVCGFGNEGVVLNEGAVDNA
jgi:hypothetical protein